MPGFSQVKGAVNQQAAPCSINILGNNNSGVVLKCTNVDREVADQIRELLNSSQYSKDKLSYISQQVSALRKEISKPTPNDGILIPGNEPTPPHANCTNMPTDSLFVFLGNSSIIAVPKDTDKHVIVNAGGEELLSLSGGPRGITISANLFTAEGTKLAEINRGAFHVLQSDLVKAPDHPDEHTLIVYGRWDEKPLEVRYLNPSAIRITGNFVYKNCSVLVTDQTTTLSIAQRIVGRADPIVSMISLHDRSCVSDHSGNRASFFAPCGY